VLAANVAFLWAAMALAVAAWWPIHADPRMVLAAGGAVVIGTVIAVIAAVRRWSSAVVLPLVIVAFAATGVPLAVPDRAVAGVLPSVQGLLELFSGVALGWKQLLTISLPVGSYQALLVPLFVSALVGTVVAASLALRARYGDVAVLVPVALLLTGIAFGSREPHQPLPLALGLLAVTLTWLLWRRWYRRRLALRASGVATGRRVTGIRTVIAATLVLLIAGAGAIAATTVAPPTNARSVLRDAVERPFDPRDEPSPLAGFRQYLRDDRGESVILEVEGLPAGALVRVATLDSYDGVVFAVGSEDAPTGSGTFTRVPTGIDRAELAGERLSLDVTVGDYVGVWVPTVGDLESVTFRGDDAAGLRDGFVANEETGTAAVAGGLDPGDRYRLETVLPVQPSRGELAGATPGATAVPPLTGVPDAVAATVSRYAGSSGSAGQRLVAAVEGLRSEGYISHGGENEAPSRSGHSADRITELLGGRQLIGDAEQYAVVAALMARELGFPSRVVFGFDPAGEEGTVAVTGSMVSAWIEVDTAEYGWVTLQATPDEREIPEAPPEDPSSVSRPQSIIQPPLEEPEQTDTQAPSETTDDPPAPDPAWLVVVLTVVRVLGVVLLVAGLVLAPFLGVIAAKARRRRRRRRAATPLERISGGWREFEDAAIDRGLTPPPSATRSEFAASVGGTRTATLALATDRAVFSPTDPDQEQVDAVWRSVEELELALDEERTRWQRLRARISLRSLSRYHRRRKGGLR